MEMNQHCNTIPQWRRGKQQKQQPRREGGGAFEMLGLVFCSPDNNHHNRNTPFLFLNIFVVDWWSGLEFILHSAITARRKQNSDVWKWLNTVMKSYRVKGSVNMQHAVIANVQCFLIKNRFCHCVQFSEPNAIRTQSRVAGISPTKHTSWSQGDCSLAGSSVVIWPLIQLHLLAVLQGMLLFPASRVPPTASLQATVSLKENLWPGRFLPITIASELKFPKWSWQIVHLNIM